MRKSIFIVITLINWMLLFSQTVIPEGDVSGNWSVNGSPYMIEGEITIADGETLSIDPGVIVKFQGHYKFDVQGQLLAIGNQQNLIMFTVSDTTGYFNNTHTGWHGIRFFFTPITNNSSIIDYCLFEFGKAVGEGQFDDHGGAFYVEGYNKISLTDCIFRYNYSEYLGGAIFCGTDIILNNLLITNNHADSWGGGICMPTSNAITNSIIVNNSSDYGGGIGCYGSNVELNNLTLYNNIAISSGGGISVTASNVELCNVICWNNYPEQIHSSSGIAQPTTFLNFNYCNIEGGEADLNTTSTIVNWLEGNINLNPFFINPENDNYQLFSDSPCINTGIPDTTGLNIPEIDFAGNPRIFEARIDMGAYEWQGTGVDNIEIPIRYQLKNHPNPFNPSTTIEFSTQNYSEIEVSVFNIKGQKVKTIFHNEFSKGTHSVIWNGDDDHGDSLCSGIYYYKLNINGKTEAFRKCLLLK